MEETGFLNDQKRLDTVYYLMKGLSYRQIAEKVDKQISYVQRVMDFLRENGLLYWGRWAPNVYRIGMKKSIALLDWKDREIPMRDNSKYETFVNYVQARKTKVCAIYTYPRDDEELIEGDKGEQITPFYHTHTRFTAPLFKKIDLAKEFFDTFDSLDNDRGILSGKPSFETEPSYTDPMTVYICRYGELLPDLTPGALTEKLKKDFKDNENIEVNYNRVRDTLNKMKDDGVIFPKNMLWLRPLSFQRTLARMRTDQIYRIMKTFNEFNMLTQLALTKEPDEYYLFVEYPFHQFSEILEILSSLDPDLEAYVMSKHIDKDTIYYQWSLERMSKENGHS
ncbi:MAG: hypothetical protein WBA22_18770 [Candidatus Methanofastidiosia archaeon]